MLLALATLCGLSTGLRAREWSRPLRLAMLEAARHPQSPRATYGLVRAMLIESDYRRDSPLLAQAKIALENAMRVPHASIMPEFALINLASRTGEAVDENCWDSMEGKLQSRAPTIEDVGALRALTDCIVDGTCEAKDADILRIYVAAVAHDPPDPSALYSYAIIAYRRLHDSGLALRLAHEAADLALHDPQYRLNLVNFLISLRRGDEAAAEMEKLKHADPMGRLSVGVADADRRLRELQATAK
jgi:hypothetical protein